VIPRRLFLAGAAALPLAGIAAPALSASALGCVALNDRIVSDDNPALRVARLLIDRFGVDFRRGIDFESFISAIEASDQPVALAGGGTEPRYRIHGDLPAFETPLDELTALLGAMQGTATFNGERWFIAAGVA
jgi:hypothetical protein